VLAVLRAWLAKVKLVGEREAVGVPAAAPVPVSVMVCGLPVALSVIVTAADRAPEAVGLNVTLTVHIDETATLPLQVFETLKSPAFVPVGAMLEIVTAADPVFVIVAVCAVLVVFTVWLANVSVVGATVIVIVAAAPVPVSVTVCGLPVALSAIESVAERAPLAAGLNVTLIAQLVLPGMPLPQVFVCAKSPALAPVNEIPEIVSAVALVSESVMLCAVLCVFRPWLENVSEVGDRVVVGTAVLEIVIVRVADDEMVKFASPLYVATIECAPSASSVMV
jgi:hypothetical protein